MRYMIVIKATKDSEASVLQPDYLLAEMAAYHDRGANRSIVDGPFAETKELIAGYTIIQVKTRAEAVEWTEKSDCEIEVRQMFELEDFGEKQP